MNHDLKLLRKMFNWPIRKGYVSRTLFKIGFVVDRKVPETLACA